MTPPVTRAQTAEARAVRVPAPPVDVTASDQDDERDSVGDGQEDADVTVRPASVSSRRSTLSRREDEEVEFLEEQIWLLKDQLSDLKAERNLELLQEEERKSELEQKKAELFEERHKCAFGDPNLLEIDKKIDSLNATLEVIRSVSTRKGIEYERAYEKGMSRLERLERKHQREVMSDASSRRSASIASIPQDNRIDVIERWNARQAEARKKSDDDMRNLEVAQRLVEQQVRDKQEEEDRKVAEALQAEIDKDQQEIEKLQKARDEKKNRLAVPSAVKLQCKEVKPFVPSCSTPLDKDQMLTAMFARQGTSKDLPYFDGSPEQWICFKNQFSTSTQLCNYSNHENLPRLVKCLKGEALVAVKSLLTVPDNVPEILTRLEECFGDPEIIVENLLSEIKLIPQVKEGRPEGLVEYGTAVMNLTATLKSLGSKEHLHNLLLVKELQNKLPFQFKFQWSKYSEIHGKNLLTLSEWLKDEVRHARKLCVPKALLKVEEKKDRENKQKSGKPSGRCLAVTADKPFVKKGQTDSRPCFICGKDGHFAGKCKVLLDKNPEDRFKLAMEKRLCTSCLIPGHHIKDCRRKRPCGVRDCKKEHHAVLHKDQTESANVLESKSEPEKEETINSITTDGNTLMGALPVILSGPSGEIKCLAFIDSGSTVTLLKDKIAEQLGITGPVEPFCLKAFNSDKSHKNSKVLSLGIRGPWKKAKSFNINGVRSIEDLPIGKMSQDASLLKKRYPEFQSLSLPSFSNEEPGILIGMRELHLFAPLRIVGRNLDTPTAMYCHLGWRVGGPNDAGKAGSSVSVYHSCNVINVDESLSDLVKRSFTTEDFGVKAAPTLVSTEAKKAMKIMEETTSRVPGTERFQTGLLWRDDNVKLPESKNTAVHRLYCQERKMDKSPEFADVYCKKIQEYLDKGFCRKLSVNEAAVKTDRTWYLPHFGVWNPNKPGKLRLVYDAAAKSHGVSLNDALMSGPDLNNSLVSVLWKFRQYEFAYAGDIKDMFHRVYVRPEDRSSQRFLWRGTRRDVPPEEFEMVVMTFGATCSPTSAQFVLNKNADEFAEGFPEACEAIKRNKYVDDLLRSDPEKIMAEKTIEDIVTVCSKGGFHICNWQANRFDLLDGLPDDLKCSDMKEIGDTGDETTTARVLGLWWDPRRDEFTFNLKMHKVPKDILERKRKPTKRDVLRVMMSVYDPLGFVGHLTVKAKILNQDLWRTPMGWDEEIPESLNDRWNSWLDELEGIKMVRIKRCYSSKIPIAESVQLHVFCDASEKAFAAIAFLRVQTGEEVDVNIITSKNRVAPLKPLSIPRLELQGALMASRIASALNEELGFDINSTTFWTDSMTVLKWIRSDARTYKQFIAHRLGEILESTTVAQWRYVPTKLNVADDATRDNEPSDLNPSSRWFLGPEFLKEDPTVWPLEKNVPDDAVNSEDLELKSTVFIIDTAATIIQFERFSRYQKILRTMALILRMRRQLTLLCSLEEYSVEELKKSEIALVKLCQEDSFPEELRALNGGKEVDRKSKILSLEPFMDPCGVMRVKGRLGRCGEAEDYRHPAILDGVHHLTRLILQWYHEECAHQGERTVANLVRQKFWVTGGMNTVKKTFRDCLRCQRRKLKVQDTRMADLPLCRMQIIRPFHNTGMDYFGPIVVKLGRRNEKRWGVIFTCLATRAVHLEVAATLSTDSAIIAVMGLASRRGRPQRIYSDNGTNFHGANNELKKALSELNQDEITRRLAMKEMQWIFNPPAAPHMGGSWERLVGSVKRTMEGIMTSRHPNDETLRAVFYEVEYLLNCRPLIEVPVDPNDPEPLTPNHFLIGWQGGSRNEDLKKPVWGEFEDSDLFLRKTWRTAQRLADQFWNRWLKDYLPTLTRRPKWMKTKDPVKLDDVVLMVDDTGPRHSWPLGRITAVYPGKDGEIRIVEVKTATGIYKRPSCKIVKLQVRRDEVPPSGGRMWKGREGLDPAV